MNQGRRRSYARLGAFNLLMADAQRRLEEQESRIRRLAVDGRDTRAAESLLKIMQRRHWRLREHRTLLLFDLARHPLPHVWTLSRTAR
jgi:hypothetical protein